MERCGWGSAIQCLFQNNNIINKASSSQAQSKKRWFFVECVADLGKLLLKDVVDARTLSGLKKKMKKYLEEKSTEEAKYGETPSGSENPLT